MLTPIRTHRWVTLILFSCALSNMSCQSNFSDRYDLHPNAKQAIDSLFSSAPHLKIDLDRHPEEVLYPNLVIGADESGNAAFNLAAPKSATIIGDSLYIVDQRQHAILVAHKDDSTITRKISREGGGPTELSRPDGIFKTSEYIFVHDSGNSRIQVFSHDLQHIMSLPQNALGPIGAFSSGAGVLFFDSGSPSNFLVGVRSSTLPFDELNTPIAPRIIQVGQQPSVYSLISLASNLRGDVVYAYSNLPYLFLIDKSLDQYLSIEFTGGVASSLNERMKKSRSVGGVPSIPGFLSALAISETGLILFRYGFTLYLFLPSQGEYRLVKRLRLDYPVGLAMGGKQSIAYSNILIDEDQLYVFSDFDYRIFRYTLGFY